MASASIATMAPLDGPDAVTATIDRINQAYTSVHEEYENNFWSTKMGLSGSSPEKLSSTKTALEAFLADPANLADVEKALKADGVSEEQRQTLECLRRTFAVSQLPDEASRLRAELNELEAALAADRREMKLGYEAKKKNKEGENDEGGVEFVEASTVQLRQLLRSSDDEATREAAWKGLRSIGPRVAERFADIVRKRNAMARAVSGDNEDYYDFKVRATEAMTKRELFEILEGLEQRTRPLAVAARERLASLKGEDALKPWNRPAALAGESERALDPYFAFEDAVSVWARSFAALGVTFGGGESKLVLDLCDRKGKYSNGFCHWPRLSSVSVEGRRLSAEARLSSLATPDAVGSGKRFFLSLFSWLPGEGGSGNGKEKQEEAGRPRLGRRRCRRAARALLRVFSYFFLCFRSCSLLLSLPPAPTPSILSFLPPPASLSTSLPSQQKNSKNPIKKAAPPSRRSSTSAATPHTLPTSSRGRRSPRRSAPRPASPTPRRSRCFWMPSPTTPRGRGGTAASERTERAMLLLNRRRRRLARRRRGWSSKRRSRTRTHTRCWP